jgi:hypothetical protein
MTSTLIWDKIRGENHQKTREDVGILLQLHKCKAEEKTTRRQEKTLVFYYTYINVKHLNSLLWSGSESDTPVQWYTRSPFHLLPEKPAGVENLYQA